MAGERILIVDDSPEIVDFLLAILKPRGYVLSATGDGKDGLTRAVYEAPDLVLLDLNLPSMSGISILEALHQRKLDTPVIVMTFHGSESVVSRALRLGARGYLVKPFEVDDILAAIERVLREERDRRTQDLFDDDLAGLQPACVMDASVFAAYVAELSTMVSRQDLLKKLTEVMLPVAAAQVGAIFLRNGGSGLVLAGLREEGAYRTDVNVSDGHANSVMRSRQPSYVLASSEPPTFARQLGMPVRSLLYVPVASRGRVMGVLCAGYDQQSQEPTAEIENWLVALGQYAALLLESFQLRHAMRRSIPAKKVYDVLNLVMRRAVKPLQVLWRADEMLSSRPDSATAAKLAQQAKVIATVLSVFKDIATPDSAIFIGVASVTAIEKELDARLAPVAKVKGE